MPRYIIQSPVKHGGRIMKSGVLSLEPEEAEPLLKSGALSPEEAEEPEHGDDNPPDGPSDDSTPATDGSEPPPNPADTTPPPADGGEQTSGKPEKATAKSAPKTGPKSTKAKG
jgi:hypothetical protein